MSHSTDGIDNMMHESRRFPPSPGFAVAAHIGDAPSFERLREHAAEDPVAFWSEVARTDLRWMTPFTKGLDASNYPFFKWFEDGELNLTDNCLDRHCETWRRNKAAIIWEGEPDGPSGHEVRTLTYEQLRAEVCRFANALKRLGVHAGDRVAIYMPMVPEAAIAMLGCARVGAVHSVIFGGFSADAIRTRVEDAQAKVIVTADGGWRRGTEIPLKPQVDEALRTGAASVRDVIVLRRTGSATVMEPGRDHDWHALLAGESDRCEPARLGAEHPLFILYTSGTTGKPKGVVHTTGGYLAQVTRTTKWIFDLKDEDVYWCTADVGWVTGHSYVVYGILSNGGTTLMYEGAPNEPRPDRLWEMIARHRVSIFYTAPTAIRAFVKWGDHWPNGHDLSSLRLLGTVGEPINPEAWMWYHRVIGGGRCPIVDTWWQTETGGIMISPIPGVTDTVPGTATRPFPGIRARIVDFTGRELALNEGGFLVIDHPWPGMLRTIFNDPDRFVKQYFSEVDGVYFTGDGARRDEDGHLWIMGRVDDVVNVSGHRLGTAEVESALVSHGDVAEAAVVGRPDDLKGQALVAFVTLKSGIIPTPEEAIALKAHVVKEIGSLARPEEVRFAEALPKTRSGKIMRRLLRELASSNTVAGDTTTLEDFGVIERLRTVAGAEEE